MSSVCIRHEDGDFLRLSIWQTANKRRRRNWVRPQQSRVASLRPTERRPLHTRNFITALKIQQ